MKKPRSTSLIIVQIARYNARRRPKRCLRLHFRAWRRARCKHAPIEKKQTVEHLSPICQERIVFLIQADRLILECRLP